MIKTSKLLIVYLVLLSQFSLNVFAEATHSSQAKNWLNKSVLSQEKLYNYNFSDRYDFEGIVALSNCSGAVVKFIGQPLTDNALVLTNGHCLGRPFLGPGEIVYKKRVNRTMKVSDSEMNFYRVKATELIYGTMTDTDAAIYKLKETYAQLERSGIRAFELSDQRPDKMLPIDIVSGYHKRGYSCEIEAFIFKLKESSWTFSDSIRYSRFGCNTIGGTSGSPIIEKGTRVVVGVNNTGNESGRRCTMNNPCEVGQNGSIRVIKGASYGQQTYQFYSCLKDNFEIDITLPGCALPK